ncbi:MAG: VWA domain-containing protein [Cyanobacteriota bacterium]|nr:VWA domain-containing protein [Cyanobacteriota bacterium]
MEPTLLLRPLRPAVAAGAACTLDLLITIQPPPMPDLTDRPRPPLNLALVIDRSGSMGGSKLDYAKKAACFVAAQLTSADRLAVLAFDNEVTLVVGSTPVQDPQWFTQAINRLECGGSTALFDGWHAGVLQVAKHFNPAALNRVLLLSDGQANSGLTDTRAIARKVSGLTERGVSTSAFGLGEDFDEDLMGAMVTAGNGTLAHIESPQQLEELYAAELRGLATTAGRNLTLSIQPLHGAEVLEVLNHFPLSPNGHHQLPDLRLGQELNVAVRLKLPPWQAKQAIARVHLDWTPPGNACRQHLQTDLSLPIRAMEEIDALPEDPIVAAEFAIQQANLARKKAIECIDRGDIAGAQSSLALARYCMAPMLDDHCYAMEFALMDEHETLLLSDPNKARKGLSKGWLRSILHVWDDKKEPAKQ